MWKTGDLAQKRLVLRMIFDELLVYDHEKGFYTATFSLPIELSCVPELDKMEVVDILRKSLHRLEEMILGWAEQISLLSPCAE